jgi:hypothetical protein
VFAFVFGAFGPVCAAFLTVALGCAYAVASVSKANHESRLPTRGRLFIAGIGGALLAMAVVALAPGNVARQAYFPHPPNLPKVVLWSAAYTVFMFCRPLVPFLGGAITAMAPRVVGGVPRWLPTALSMGTSAVPMLIVIAVSASLAQLCVPGTAGIRFLNRARWWLPCVAFILVCACMAPGAYGTSAPPPPRALIIPQFVIICLAACWGFAMGATVWRLQPRLWQSRRGLILLIAGCACLLGPVAATPQILSAGYAMREWAHRWDATDQQLRAARGAGMQDATVPALEKLAGVGSISPDPQDWVNICAAHYYGLRSITGNVASR